MKIQWKCLLGAIGGGIGIVTLFGSISIGLGWLIAKIIVSLFGDVSGVLYLGFLVAAIMMLLAIPLYCECAQQRSKCE